MIMVDELQDTNARQIALLAALDRDNLFTVGDEHQSIYGFRHADVEIFRERGERLAQRGRGRRAAHQLPLRGRRCSPRPARSSRRASAGASPRCSPGRDAPVERAGARAAGRRPRRLGGPRGASRHRARARAAVAPRRGAPARAAHRRADRRRRGGPRGDRRAAPRGDPDRRLRGRAGRPRPRHARDGGRRLLSSAPRSSTSSRTCACSPTRSTISRSTACSPRRSCGADDRRARRARRALARARPRALGAPRARAPGPRHRASWRRACVRARARAAREPLAATVAAAVADGGYDRHLAAPALSRAAHRQRPQARAARARLRAPRGPRPARVPAALAAGRVGAAREVEAPPPAAGTGAIRLMTIHAAKGLEFPVVCVADLAHTSSTNESPLLTDGRPRRPAAADRRARARSTRSPTPSCARSAAAPRPPRRSGSSTSR